MVVMNGYLLFSFIFCFGVAQANFLQDAWYEYQGHLAYNRSDFDQAGKMYTKLLQQNPYSPTANYNMGLVLYAQKNYDASIHSFERAAKQVKGNQVLQEQALFNQGNVYVEQKKLCEAMTAYSKVLELNPKNDRARHNLEYVKKMLQEQQNKNQENDQQQQQNNDLNDQQKGDQNQQQKSPSKKSDQTNQNQLDQQNDSSETNKTSAQDDASKKQSSESKDSGKESKNQQTKNESSDKASSEKSKEDVAQQLQKSDKANETESKSGNGKNQSSKQQTQKEDAVSQDVSQKLDEKSGYKEISKDLQGDRDQSVALSDAYADEMQQTPDNDQRLDKRAVLVMQKLQEQEDYMQKQLLKMNVSKQGAFGHGQKNW